MLIDILKKLFRRDLLKLIDELELYQNEADIWRVDQNISNSAGNLCLHLIGNLNTYIGAELGKTGYVRNRPAEFSLKNISRNELITSVSAVINMIDVVLTSLNKDQLTGIYPQLFAEEEVSTVYFLMHLATHLNYHLGQINYHRRLLAC